MGCDFSHGDLRMSYSGFASLREKLAGAARLRLRDMAGYGGTKPWNEIDDPLVPLLTAHDEYGGGQIAATHCLALQRRIRELALRFPDCAEDRQYAWRERAEKLAHAIAQAAFLGEDFYWF